MFGAVFLLAQYLQIVHGLHARSRPGCGRCRGPRPRWSSPRSPALLASRTGLRALLVTGLVLQAASLVWLASVDRGGLGLRRRSSPALVMAGVGMGLTFAPSATAVLDGLPDDDFGTASSANSTIREFGVALGVAGLTAVFLGNGGELTPTGYTARSAPPCWSAPAAVARRRRGGAVRPGPEPGLRPSREHAVTTGFASWWTVSRAAHALLLRPGPGRDSAAVAAQRGSELVRQPAGGRGGSGRRTARAGAPRLQARRPGLTRPRRRRRRPRRRPCSTARRAATSSASRRP